MRPSDFMTFHIESIIRSKGAKHLTPVSLSLYSTLLLDVAALILIPLIAIDAAFNFILWKCYESYQNKKQTQTKKSNKTKEH